VEVKKSEKDFHDSEGFDYELLWVRHPRFEHHYKRMASHVKNFFGADQIVTIDIGCGTGRGSLFFVDFGNMVIGLDISRELLKIFKAKLNKADSRLRTELILCDAEALPLKKCIADLVTFWGTLHHLPNKSKALTEAASLLKDGKILVLHEPNVESSRAPWVVGKLLNWIPHILLKPKYKTNDNKPKGITPYEQPLRLRELEMLVKKCNLEIVEIKTVWFFGIVLLQLPKKVCEVYYFLANKFDHSIENYLDNGGGALFIVARSVESVT
jgi:ubiquinone/menaquinone biosynthesis C-methylase UbiE